MDRLWYVTANGEPLGVMTMRDALQYGFEHGDMTLFFENLETKQKRRKKQWQTN